jgi:hypothetical protein
LLFCVLYIDKDVIFAPQIVRLKPNDEEDPFRVLVCAADGIRRHFPEGPEQHEPLEIR